jgi:demethoxyubiquinone hydroxylase (CLK1/Coq7/Cat5 family)
MSSRYSTQEEEDIEQLSEEYYNVFLEMIKNSEQSLNSEISVFKNLITTIVSELR